MRNLVVRFYSLSQVWKAGLIIAAASSLGCETNITQAKGNSVKYKLNLAD